MKTIRLALMISVAAMVIMMTGCSSSAQRNINTDRTVGVHDVSGQKFVVDNTLPIWVGEAQYEVDNGIAAVGSTRYSKFGDEVMVPQAKLNAKAELAGMIEEKIFVYQTTPSKNARIEMDDTNGKVFNDAAKRIVNQSMSGVRTISRYHSPVTGELYIRVFLPLDEVKNVVNNSKEELKAKYEAAGMTSETAEILVQDILLKANKEWAQ